MAGGHPGDGFLAKIALELDHRFSIDHSTIQIEVIKLQACLSEDDCSGRQARL
jgi:cobalt-zinc-cadmium efflux system protein